MMEEEMLHQAELDRQMQALLEREKRLKTIEFESTARLFFFPVVPIYTYILVLF